jgi:diguanylate cyclase (GGDEF)-like protein
LAERIRQDVESQEFDAGGRALTMRGSFGVATFPEDATSAQQLMRQADQRLYYAKQHGRNQVRGRR